MFRFLLTFIIVVLTLLSTGCGGSGEENNPTKITGYVEDDPISNAEVKIFDSFQNLIVKTTTDTNGKYTLNTSLKEGERYILEASGKLLSKNITLHSIFKYSKDATININPITELKYQLVQSGKSIDEAEQLIRDYFMIISGNSLESNRFDMNSPISVGMLELAKLYDGNLPVDAIEKIKNDILSNSTLKEEDREYQYREMLKADLELVASTDSQEVGKNITISLKGVDNLNPKYSIEWIGIPNDINKEKLTQTFTLNEPQKRIVIASLYLKDEQNSSNKIFLHSASTQVDFYKVGKVREIVAKDGDINSSISSDVKINIPNGALSEGEEIFYKDIITQNSDYIKAFILEPSGKTFSKPLEIHVKYDLSQINDPRLLTIIRVSDDGKRDILKVKRIDYEKSELIFETEHFSKFWIKRHGWFWMEKTSFAKWDEAGSSFSITIRNLNFPEYSPYHYLAESLDLYCKVNKIDDSTCKIWLKYFRSKEKSKLKDEDDISANSIESSYQKFFNQNDNYDIFINDYYNWLLVKKKPGFPYTSQCDEANKCFEDIRKLMYSRSLEDGNRKFNFFNYLNSAIGWIDILNPVDPKINKAVSNTIETLALTEEYLQGLYDVLKDNGKLNNSILLEKVSAKKTSYIISMYHAEFIISKIIEEVPIVGKVYSEVFSYGMSLVTRWEDLYSSDREHVQQTMFPILDKYGLNKFIYFLLKKDKVKNIEELFDYNPNIPNYSVNKEGKFLVNGQILSQNKSYEAVCNLFKDPGNDRENANNYLASVYATLSFYSKIYFSKDNNSESNTSKKFRLELNRKGMATALQILEYADKVKVNDLVFNKQAKLKKSKLSSRKQKEPLERSFKKVSSQDSQMVTIPVLDGFDDFLEQIKINIPKSKWNSVKIKKLSLRIEKYGIEKEDSTDTTKIVFETSSFDGVSSFSKSNISKSGFNLADEKYTKSLASIFTDLDSGNFQDKFLIVKASILISLNGKDRVVSKDYQFITYTDTEEDELDKVELKYSKLSGEIIDSSTDEYISNAKVRILSIDRETKTDESGKFSFSMLPPNSYTLEVSKDGYITMKIPKVIVREDKEKILNIYMPKITENNDSDKVLEIIDMSLNDNQFKAIFNKDMTESYFTEGDYEIDPDGSYWLDKRTFIMNLKSYTSGGKLTLLASGFESEDGEKLSQDKIFIFP